MYSSQRGITWIEVLISLFIGSVVIAALTQFVAFGFPISRSVYAQVQANETGRLQLKRITKALREARPSDTGSYSLATAQPQKLVFFANVDGDALTERITYELVGTTLVRRVLIPSGDPLTYNSAAETSAVVASYIRNGSDPIFTYYDGQYPTVTTPLNPVDVTEVKYIQFSLVIDVDTTVNPSPVTMSSHVQLRNLKTNLAD